jgi:HlyD family secretion protein
MHRDNVLLVPNTALRFTPSTGGVSVPNKNSLLSSMMPRGPGSSRKPAASGANLAAVKQVWVLQNHQAVAVAVTPGISDGHMTEIIGGDLQPGMQVITDQQHSPPP